MSLISNSSAIRCTEAPAMVVDRRRARVGFNCVRTNVSLRRFQLETPCIRHSSMKRLTRMGSNSTISMALVNERLTSVAGMGNQSGILAYDLVQGELVKWSSAMDKAAPDPPTAVLVHGILGCRKNWGTFARRLAESFPMWQFLLVDLRCHGESALIKKRQSHTVAAAALDVLKLVAQLRITPRVLVGHSFGGKVVLSMVDQAAKPLARPVKVWVLDATPGKVRPGGHGEDRPAELISFLRRVPKETKLPWVRKFGSRFMYCFGKRKVSSKSEILDALLHEGFSEDVARWVVTNLQRSNSLGLSSSKFSWVFDLEGIAEMYHSYEETNLWKVVEDVPPGVHVNFLKAERSLHRWALEDLQRIHAAEEVAADDGAGVQMHVLEDAGHWVQADNPDGLFRILSSSFEGIRMSFALCCGPSSQVGGPRKQPLFRVAP